MKSMLLIPVFFVSLTLNAQRVTNDDIAFKAKLLTVFRLGIASQETIIRDLNAQELKFLTADTARIVIMKVTFGQHNFHGETSSTAALGQCFYYVGYNRELYKFYRLGGFDSSDAHEFFADLKANEFIALTSDERIISEIDLTCLARNSKRANSRRSKRRPCDVNCSSTLSTYMQVH
ncbi:MAG TPA: hypothetical protein VF490_00690 [Chryseosolibacter sp.]